MSVRNPWCGDDPHPYDASCWTQYQYNILILVQSISGTLSIVGSVWIIYDLRKDGRLKWPLSKFCTRNNNDDNDSNDNGNNFNTHDINKSTEYYLIFMIALLDMIYTLFAYILYYLMQYIESGDVVVPKVYGNYTSCIANLYVWQLSASISGLYNIILSLFYVLTVNYNWEERRFQTRCCRFWMIYFPILTSLTFTTIGITISSSDSGYQFGEYSASFCTESNQDEIFTKAAFSLLFNVVLLISIVMLWKFSRKHQLNNANYQQIENLQDDTNASHHSINKMAKIGILFSLSSLVTSVWLILRPLWKAIGGKPFSVQIIENIFLPLQGFFTCIVYFYRKDQSIFKAITNLWRNTRKKRWLLKVEKYEGWKLTDAPSSILQDEDVIQAAMENNPSDATAMFAIRQTGWALKFSSEDMKNDREVVLTAVAKSGGALVYASNSLRSDDDVIVMAVRQNPTALQFATEGKNQSQDFLRTAGLWEDISRYDSSNTKVVLSTRFSLGETTSTTATIFALLLRKNQYFNRFNIYFPNAFNKTTCDPNWTDIRHPCRGTFDTCCKPERFKTGVPTDESCWRYSFRYHLETGHVIVQIVEYYNAGEEGNNVAQHIIGKGQNIETEMASTVGRKVFRCFQPVTQEGKRIEFEVSMIRDLSEKVQYWNDEDSSNLDNCNLHWKKLLGIWLVREGSPQHTESV